MVRYANGGLKTGLEKACFSSKMSGFWMVSQVMWPFEFRTPKVSRIWVSGIQMVTVIQFFSDCGQLHATFGQLSWWAVVGKRRLWTDGNSRWKRFHIYQEWSEEDQDAALPGTVTIWIPEKWIADKSGIQMVQTCPIDKWFRFSKVGLNTRQNISVNWTKNVCFMVWLIDWLIESFIVTLKLIVYQVYCQRFYHWE